jgi:CubicO group peptidase (beta-lactamase class C family)
VEVPESVIQSFLESQAATEGFSGAVLIARDGLPVLQEAYGLADRSPEIPNQADTKFNLGSMDKMFTAVAIMQLVEQGKLSLDEEVGEYLPDYPNPEVADSVTLHQLLMHTSGLGNYFDSPLYLDRHDQIRSLADYLSLFADEPLQFQPGAQFAYSNSGYIVLGLIIEAVSGQSYYDYVQAHIFEPSGMHDTACYELDAGTPNLAIGYTTFNWHGDDTGQVTDNASMLPMRGGSAGGGYSTVPDLLAFSKALFNDHLLSLESTELLMKGKIQLQDNVQYAYGFFDMIVQGHRRVGHGGGFPGICSILSIYPELGYTVVILSNRDGECVEVNDFITETLLK